MSKKSSHQEENLIDSIKLLLKENPTIKEMFRKYKIDIEKLDEVPIEFAKLKVSAKTKNEKIFINEDFLDKDFSDDIHYFAHELCHWLQQHTDSKAIKSKKSTDYLDLPTEIEAFHYQIKFMKQMYGKDRADEYLEDLLDFHEYDGKTKAAKKKEILAGL